MVKYQLVDIRPTTHQGTEHAVDGRMLAIIRPTKGGRRLTAVISKEDCMSWSSCRAAIVRFHNKDGVKRLDESDLIAPPANGDLPWHHDAEFVPPNQRTRYDAANARLTGTDGLDRSAGQMYRPQVVEFTSNQDYLRRLDLSRGLPSEVHFEDNSVQARIEKIDREIERLETERERRYIEVLRAKAEAEVLNPLLSLTPLGRAVLASRGR